MWRDVPSPKHPSLNRPYCFIRHGRSHEITLACFLENSCPRDLYRYCDKLELVHARQIEGTMMRGFRGFVSKFSYQNLFSRDFNIVRVFDPDMRKKVTSLLKSDAFDIIYADQEMYPYVYNLHSRTPIAIEFFNPTLYNLRQKYLGEQSISGKIDFLTQYYSYRLDAPRYVEFDAGIFVSELHRRLSAPFVPMKSFIIPPPIDLKYFSPVRSEVKSRNIVFTASMNNPVNIHSMLYFCREVFPLIRKHIPETKLHIVGRSPPDRVIRLASSSVVVKGEVPDTRPYLRDADVVIAPITLDDGGIKTKVLEAMAMGKAVVSTALGARGIGASHGVNIIIAQDSKSFARWVVKLLQDVSLREQIGTRARDFIAENFSHEKTTRRLEDVFAQIAKGRQSEVC